MRRWLIAVILLTVLTPPAFAQDIDLASEVRQYIAEAGDTVGIACYPIEQPQDGYFANADQRYPLASTIKIMILGVYAQGAASGRFDPTERVPLSALDAYYLPGTDAGAQPAFLEAVTPDADNTISLSEVVYGMIRFSSNAAADYLHARMTDDDFTALYRLLGIENTDVPVSFLSLMLAQDNHEMGISEAALPRDELRASAEQWADQYVSDPAWRAAERRYHRRNTARYEALGKSLIETQAAFFEKYDNRGTPDDFAKVMATVQRGDTLLPTAVAVMHSVLQWPMQFENNREHFLAVGMKGGSLPGILTGAYFAQPKGSRPLVLAVFYHDLAPDRYVDWLHSYQQQELEFYVLQHGCDWLSG